MIQIQDKNVLPYDQPFYFPSTLGKMGNKNW